MSPILLTQQLVQLDTTNPGSSERAAAHMLGRLLERAGFSVSFYEYAAGRTSLVAFWGDSEAGGSICFTGHLDTVPLGRAKWSVDPFSGHISNDKLYGRGATDMKAGVAAFVCAAVDFARDSGTGGGITLVITAGEETGCIGAKHLREVDGALGKAGAIVVGEPTSNYPLVGHKGALWLALTTTGTTGHGSMPHTGVNAIYRAADVISALQALDLGGVSDELFGNPTVNVATINGGLNINSIPDLVHIGVDFRTVPSMSNGDLQNEVARQLGARVSSTVTIADLEPVASDPNDNWITDVFDICAHHLDARPVPRTGMYFTDACVLQPAYGGAPVVILGPGEPELAHQTDEYCYTWRIEQVTAIYREIMEAWRDQTHSPPNRAGGGQHKLQSVA